MLNQARSFQDNDFVLNKGAVKLVMTHIGMYGISRLSAYCVSDKVEFFSEIGISDAAQDPASLSEPSVIVRTFRFVVMADRYHANPTIISEQSISESVIATRFSLSDSQLSSAISASRLDVRLVRENGAFLGAGFRIEDGKFKDLIESCQDLTPALPSSLGGEPDLQEPLSPVFVATTLSAAAPKQSPVAEPEPLMSDEMLATAIYDRYLEAWSQPNDTAMLYMENAYPDVVDFYDKKLTKAEVLAEKRKFADRWPVRDYSARHDTMNISCSDGLCMIAAIIDWRAHSPVRNKTSEGVAWYGLGIDMGTGQILLENGKSRKK